MDTIETNTDSTFLQIIRDIRNDIAVLFHQEVALAKSEVKAKAMSYGKNAIFIGVSSLMGLYATFFLFLALSNLIGLGLVNAGLSVALASWLAPFLLALLLGVGAVFSTLQALKAITKNKPLTQKSVGARHDKKILVAEKVKG